MFSGHGKHTENVGKRTAKHPENMPVDIRSELGSLNLSLIVRQLPRALKPR